MHQPIQPRLLSEKEASQYICMSRSFLRQARMDGNRENRTPAPPFIKIGRAVRDLSPKNNTMTLMRFPINWQQWRSQNEKTLQRRTNHQGHQAA